jgi:hypothetical protein
VLKNARQSPFTVQNAAVCALPCVSVKTHGKNFAVRFLPFAVRPRPRRTAKAGFPVVFCMLIFMLCLDVCELSGDAQGASPISSL